MKGFSVGGSNLLMLRFEFVPELVEHVCAGLNGAESDITRSHFLEVFYRPGNATVDVALSGQQGG